MIPEEVRQWLGRVLPEEGVEGRDVILAWRRELLSESQSIQAGFIKGWARYNPGVAAHFFVSGKQVCNTYHSIGESRGFTATAKEAPLSRWGLPYGRTCSRCRRLWTQTLSSLP